ncbi:MAG: PQQ-binding-like beta-propeller repeat protein [Thaumarchaeota archaeon]|nr:PQQ-binding-like beta-propeller repeat protein [Nitrososphaerota archaeon]
MLSVSVIAILAFGTIFVAIPTIPRASAQQKVPGANWEWVWYNNHGTDFNPQTQITKDNVQLLELKWIAPFPLGVVTGQTFKTNPTAAVRSVSQGFATPPLVVDGIMYSASHLGDVFAMDAGTGKIVWQTLRPATSPVLKHLHSMNYYNGKLYMLAEFWGWGDVYVLDALTGKANVLVANFTKDIPGQRYGGMTQSAYDISWAPSIYEKGNVLIVQGTVNDRNARGFIAGYDLNTGKLLWRWYSTPPSPDCKWEANQANDARKGNIDPALAVGDWGTRCDLNGAANSWGHISIDEDKGLAYFATAGPYPTWNATHKPGPNLYSNIIGALDAKTGELKWYYQTTTHDVHGEQDCKEGTMLIKGATVQGQKRNLIWNLCRSFVYILDADTGKLVYSYDRWEKKAQGTNPRKISDVGNNMGNEMDMKLKWYQYPKTRDFTPFFGGNGGYAAYDPNTNAVYFKSVASATNIVGMLQVDTFNPPPFFTQAGIGDPQLAAKYPPSAEIVAMDLNTGQVKWKRDFGPGSNSRLNVVATGGVVCGGVTDGILRCVDAETGKDLWTKQFGLPILYAPTFGATVDGKIRMFFIFGGGGTSAGVPGAIMAFGLPDKLPEPQIVTKEIIKEVPKEVVKEVVKEVPKEVVKTVTVETVGPITYAAVGVPPQPAYC